MRLAGKYCAGSCPEGLIATSKPSVAQMAAGTRFACAACHRDHSDFVAPSAPSPQPPRRSAMDEYEFREYIVDLPAPILEIIQSYVGFILDEMWVVMALP